MVFYETLLDLFGLDFIGLVNRSRFRYKGVSHLSLVIAKFSRCLKDQIRVNLRLKKNRFLSCFLGLLISSYYLS